MAGRLTSATLEGPSGISGKYRVLKTKNTLEVKPGDMLSGARVQQLIDSSRIDLTITVPKK